MGTREADNANARNQSMWYWRDTVTMVAAHAMGSWREEKRRYGGVEGYGKGT